MSYLLIGNISALICDDCIEPLANARIRVYLPDTRYPADNPNLPKGIFHDLHPLSAKDVLMKADRLLGEASLDEHGNFSLSWDEVHLFTEPLDLCLDTMPGKTGYQQPRNYHLSNVALHWKRSSSCYIGAYAYVIPSAVWNGICEEAGSWVITGTVKQHRSSGEQPFLKVEAYNAISGKMIGHAFTNEFGRYTLRFSRRDLYNGTLQPIRQGRKNMGPDVHFRIYDNEQLVWSEDESSAQMEERRDLAPCTCLNIEYRPSVMRWASGHLQGWLNGVISLSSGKSKMKRELVRLTASYR